MNKLPRPKCKYGYTWEELDSILNKLGISIDKFVDAFGINTVTMYHKKPRYYKCDIERALFKLGYKLGKYHLWD